MDDPSRVITAEAATNAILEPPRRVFFSRFRKSQPPPLPYCENCGASMMGPYCGQCGQHAIDYRRSSWRVFLDALDSFLNWDSKFFATVALLISQPWHLTNAFLRGKRVRYVHPLRLYLLVSIVFFFGVQQLAKHANLRTGVRNRELTAEEKARIEQKLSALPSDARAEVQSAINQPHKDQTFLEMGATHNPGASGFKKWINDRVKEKIGEHGVNAKLFFLTLVSNLPPMMLCCIPLFAFVLKVLYIRQRIFYVDHLIYALHIHSFAYVAILLVGFAAATVPHLVPTLGGWLIPLLIAGALTLLLLSIRRVYEQGWVISVLKFVFGGIVYVFVLLVALGATLFVTLALPA